MHNQTTYDHCGCIRPATTTTPNLAAELPCLAVTCCHYLTCTTCDHYCRFSAGGNSADACRFHPEMYTGGEVAKAYGFVRR